MSNQARIILVVPRGEAVRNFLYSDTLHVLAQMARVTLLSSVYDEKFIARFGSMVERIIPLQSYPESFPVDYLRKILHDAHFRWQWSKVAQNSWEIYDARATTWASKGSRSLWKGMVRILGNRSSVELLSALEREASWRMRPTNEFEKLFQALKPDLVFNCSHIHGPAGDLPVRVAHRMGIKTVGFIFSWDNLTSRSRIFTPYDDYFVWYTHMRDQLLQIYPKIPAQHVFVTGTPQFDFHFKPQYWMTREEVCRRIGTDPLRPIILYTAGIDKHFPEEHRTVRLVAELLPKIDITPRPQLVVRTYVKGTSPEMKALAQESIPDVIFPPVLWDEKWLMPLEEDLHIYTGLLRHASLGINAASTVSLELMMHDKPVINLGFDPPGSNLPYPHRYSRHLEFDHYQPVATSGGVMAARSEDDMYGMLIRGLTTPQAEHEQRCQFIQKMFGNTLDGKSGQRVARKLLELAKVSVE
jgi:hypothetical protein